MTSYRLNTYGQDDDLESARFATRDEAQEVAEATEYGGDGYMAPAVEESDDAPTITAADYLAAVWSDYPGRCPAGVDPEEWFSGDHQPSDGPGCVGEPPAGVSWESWLAQNNVD